MLKQLREKAGLTQADLAYGLGYTTPQFISNIERGQALLPVEKFPKAAKLLNVPVNVLIESRIAVSRAQVLAVLKGKRR